MIQQLQMITAFNDIGTYIGFGIVLSMKEFVKFLADFGRLVCFASV